MAEREGIAAPNQKARTEPAAKSAATTKSRSCRTTTAFIHKFVKF